MSVPISEDRKHVDQYVQLREERTESKLPFSLSPFVTDESELKEGEEIPRMGPKEVRCKEAKEYPWVDLLLEVSAATSFAALADGTSVLQLTDALSYVSYFLLVWWVLASQTLFNIRFRQADWLSRLWVFLQLLVFSGMAAFTKNFSVVTGLTDVSDDQALQNQLLSYLGYDQDGIDAVNFRNDRLPRLNSRGICVVMGLSRLLLFMQYFVVLLHARKGKVKSKALYVHMGTLLFSVACYFVTFALLGKEDIAVPRTKNIAKLFLWYTPILIEILGHFVANMVTGHVRYSNSDIQGRSATLFIIVLGISLDRITSGFKNIVGGTGLGVGQGWQIFVSAALIFIFQFSLYFGTPGYKIQLGNNRAIAWYMAHFFYLAALCITLLAVASSVQYSNILNAIQTQVGAMQGVLSWHENPANKGKLLNVNDFPSERQALAKSGLSLSYEIYNINHGAELAQSQNQNLTASQIANVTTGIILQDTITIVYNTLKTLENTPEFQSNLDLKFDIFINADAVDNVTYLTTDNFLDIYNGVLTDRGSSAKWLYPAAGGTLLGLVLLSLIRGNPRDRYEWGQIACRGLIGIGIALVALLDIGSENPVFSTTSPISEQAVFFITNNRNITSKIWYLNNTGLLLPVVAVAMTALQLIEASLTLKAVQGYRSFDGLLFWHEHKRANVKKPSFAYRAASTDIHDMSSDAVPLIDREEARMRRATSYSSGYDDKYLSPELTESPRKAGEDSNAQLTEEPEEYESLVLPDHDHEDHYNLPNLGYRDPFHQA